MHGHLMLRTSTLPSNTSLGDPPPGRPGSTRGNSGTTEPAASPVVPLFPLPPKRGGHNSQKCGTGPGKQGGFSTGINEVTCSNVWIAEVRAGWWSLGLLHPEEIPVALPALPSLHSEKMLAARLLQHS